MNVFWAFVRNVAASVTAIAAAAILLWNMALWIVAPRIQPVISAMESIPVIVTRLEKIEARLPPIRVIEFEGAAFASPMQAHAGDRIRITYLVKRTSDCEVTVYVRFHDVIRDAIDTEFSFRRPAIGSPVLSSPQPRSVVIQIPPTMPPGEWAYAPVFEPGETCPNRVQTAAPLARFFVLPPEIEAK